MRHCSSCYNCVPDIRALMICGISIDKCRKHGHLILHPFFSGFRCKGYKRKKVITDEHKL